MKTIPIRHAEVQWDREGVRVSFRRRSPQQGYPIRSDPRNDGRDTWKLLANLLSLFVDLTVDYGFSPKLVHSEFMKIREYRRFMSEEF